MKEINPTSFSLPSALMCDRIALGSDVGVFIMKRKKCTKCKKFKRLHLFYNNKYYDDGLSHECKECCKLNVENYHQTKRGVVSSIYKSQLASSRNRGYVSPEYTKEELKCYVLNHPDFDKLYNNWVNSGYNRWLKPSIDRLDDYKPYSMDNIRLVTWRENNERSHSDRRNGINNKMSKAILQYDLEGNFIKEHYSMNQAARDMNTVTTSIFNACNGYSKTSCGFIWKYKLKNK